MKKEAEAPEKVEKDHKEWLKDKGIAVEDMPEALQEAVDAVAQAEKTESPEDLAAANKELLEAIQEWYYQLDEQIENIGEVLIDHEQRIEALESLPDAPTETTETVTTDTPTDAPVKLTDEEILKNLHDNGKLIVSKEDLKNLGFKTGFFSKLNVRGGTYGAYSLVKKPSEKVYNVILN